MNPAQTAGYWCRVTNNCANTADSSVVSVSVVPCSAPQIVSQPQDQQAESGTTVSLNVGVTGTSPAVSWFPGARGDTSIAVGSGETITSPPLTKTTQFWARIANYCGSVESNAATIAVAPKPSRRRSAPH